jgi:hypothetical protein
MRSLAPKRRQSPETRDAKEQKKAKADHGGDGNSTYDNDGKSFITIIIV